MKTNTMKSLRLTALSLATAMLFGCGGSDGTSGAADTAQGASTVAVSETATALRVSVSGSSDSGSAQAVLAQMQYTFSASVTAGADAGKTISGTLMLKTEQEDGATEVEGLLIPTTAAAPTATPDATAAQADALRLELKTKLGDLRTAYRADVEVMLQTLRAAMEAGKPTDGSKKLTAAQKEALATFKADFAARTERFEADVATVTQDIRAQLEALGVTLADRESRSGDDDGRKGMRGYPVKGTIDSAGVLTLKIQYGKRTVVQATGQTAADGSIAGHLHRPGQR